MQADEKHSYLSVNEEMRRSGLERRSILLAGALTATTFSIHSKGAPVEEEPSQSLNATTQTARGASAQNLFPDFRQLKIKTTGTTINTMVG